MKRLILALVCLLLAIPCQAAVITVDANGSADHDNIQAAIDVAVDGDTVIIAPGTYTGLGNRDIDFLGKAITVRSTDPNNPNIVAATIIDCNGTGADPHRGFYFHSGEDGNSILAGLTIINGYVSYGGAIYCYDGSPTITGCTISGNTAIVGGGISCRENSSPTITNCIITGNSARSYGGGIYCDHSSPTITNCIISANMTRSGGGIFCYWSSPIINNCTISGNSAEYEGGGISCRDDSSPTINNCTISNNSAKYHGGGIHCKKDSNPTITNCTISDNSAHSGGGIYCEHSHPTINNCTISGNSAKGNRFDDDGGGIYCYDSSPTITHCAISENTATVGGGGIYSFWSSWPKIANSTISGNMAADGGGIYCGYESRPTITNCTIRDNIASAMFGGYGGGIFCQDSSPTITGCTISENTATTVGGGIYCYHYSNPTITNCIITGNSTPSYGGGIYFRGSETRPAITNCTISGNTTGGDWNGGGIFGYKISLVNCILWGNTNNDGMMDELTQIYSFGEPDVTFSCIQDDDPNDTYIPFGGPDNIDDDPCFVEPGYWDANDFWVEGDYHLLPDSPCIDAGDPNYVVGPNETDIDGNPRIVDGNNDGNSVVDMGAYEFNPPVEAAMKLTPQTLNCDSKGKWVKAHLVLPEGFVPEDVDVNEPAVAELIEVDLESEYIKVLGSDKGLVKLEVVFDREAFCDAVTDDSFLTDDGSLDVTVIGSFADGRYFSGTDTIRIKRRR